MRVLVACEFTGAVRRAFRERGHDAWSCDLLPAKDGSEHHIQGSVVDHDVIKQGWDALIAFPDCTYLTVSANRWANEPWRMEARHWALAFVKTLWALPIKRKAIENPIGALSTMWRRPTQVIQPWQFWHMGTAGGGRGQGDLSLARQPPDARADHAERNRPASGLLAATAITRPLETARRHLSRHC